ncbi:MAG: M20/M25/M40 family metallo-hydrolase [Chloroflexi bacterium]|nr:M20/M25/M40 family metallo-hydrolase [Chloroflexota bacterium]
MPISRQATLDPALRDWLDQLVPTISPERLHADVVALPAPRNRLDRPEWMQQADQMILQAFQAAGWSAQLSPFRCAHVAGFLGYSNNGRFPAPPTSYSLLEGANVVACKQGTQSGEAIVVLAHQDTTSHTRGANDNTASVAALLELARAIAPYQFTRTIVLAATDMEEIGFFGAQALVADLLREWRVLAAINLETIAYTDSTPQSQRLPGQMELLYPRQVKQIRDRQSRADFTAVIYNQAVLRSAATFAAALAHLAGVHAPLLLRAPNDLPIIGTLLQRWIPAVRNFARSDHLPFWAAGIPAMMVTDTANFRYRHYHQPTDTPEKLDYQRLAAIVGATAAVLADVAELRRD